MEIKNCKFLKSCTDVINKPEGEISEIAFVGKSNVGKSSLINSLLKTKIAKTSSQPGRTRLINYFSVNNDTLRFVDLPGYGFNKASKNITKDWNDMIGSYLLNNSNLKLVVFLIDIRHTPTELDKITQLFLYNNGLPYIIVATKSDKIAKSKVKNNLNMLARQLKVTSANILPYTSLNPQSRILLLEKIQNILDMSN